MNRRRVAPGQRSGAARRRRAARSLAVRVVLVLLLAGAAATMLHLRTFPPLATVMSGSMSPAIDVGDVVVLRSMRGAPPDVGDVVRIHVSTEAQRELGYPATVVHRVVAVDTAERTVVTKGDNMTNEDPFEVPFEAIDAEVALVIPFAGRAFGFLMSPFGLIWLAIGVVLLVVMPLYDLLSTGTELDELEVAALGELDHKIDRLALEAAPVLTPTVVAPRDDTDATLRELVAAVREYGEHLRSHTAVLQAMSAAAQDLAGVTATLRPQVRAAATMPPWSGHLVRWVHDHTPGGDWALVSTDEVARAIGVPAAEVPAALDALAAVGLLDVEQAAAPRYRCRLRPVA